MKIQAQRRQETLYRVVVVEGHQIIYNNLNGNPLMKISIRLIHLMAPFVMTA
jgi:hypothetical protein